MRVLVTGHEGYLGTPVVVALRRAGHEVSGLDTGFYAGCQVGPADGTGAADGTGPAGVPALRVDLRDVAPEHLTGVDAVVHLAALSNDPLGDLDPRLTYEINYEATVRLGRAARAAGVGRLLFSSSCSLYGAGAVDGVGEQPLTEEARLAPLTPYGHSKVKSEQALAGLAGERFSPVFLRNATAYGYTPALRGDIVVNDLVGHALLTGAVRLRSDGGAWRPLVHAEDIAAAFVALLEAPREVVHARAFNVGRTAENYRIRDVAELVRELVGGEVTFAEGAGTDRRDYRVSCERIAAEVPAFKPQWTLERGIEQLAKAYRDVGLRIEDLTGARCQRLRRILELREAGRLDADLRWTAP